MQIALYSVEQLASAIEAPEVEATQLWLSLNLNHG